MNNIQSQVTTYAMKMLQPAQASETVTNRNNSVEDFIRANTVQCIFY